MSNLIEKITLIGSIFDDIANAISEKGIDIGQCEGPDTYADKIRQIVVCNHPDVPDEPDLPVSIQCDLNEIAFESDGGSKEINVSYLRYKKIHAPLIEYVSGDNWLTIDPESNVDVSTYNITVDKNDSQNDRIATITFKCEDDVATAIHKITVSQSKKDIEEIPDPRIEFDKNLIHFNNNGGTETVQVTYIDTWGEDHISHPNIIGTLDWITIESFEKKTDSPLMYECKIKVNENTGIYPRSCFISFSASYGSGMIHSENLSITQDAGTVNTTITIDADTINFGYCGECEKDINVSYNNSKSILSPTYDSWINVETSDSKTYIIKVDGNEGEDTRQGKITFRCENYEGAEVTSDLNVIQYAKPQIKLISGENNYPFDFNQRELELTFRYKNSERFTVRSSGSTKWAWEKNSEKQSDGWNEVVYKINIPENTTTSEKTETFTFEVQPLPTGESCCANSSLNISITQGARPGNVIFEVTPKNLNFDYKRGEQNVNVTCENAKGSFSVKEELDWVSTKINGNTVTISSSENKSTTNRSGIVTFSCYDYDDKEWTLEIPVSQSGCPNISVDKSEINFLYTGGTQNVNVTLSNEDDYDVECEASFVTCTKNSNVLNITLSENTAVLQPRTAIVWLYCQSDRSKSVSIEITQSGTPGTTSVTSVSLDRNTLTLEEGAYDQLIATIEPRGATNKNVSWKSSNTSVATVSNGKVTALKAGTTTITVTTEDGNKTATCAVTVKVKTIPAEAVRLDPTTKTLTVGDVFTLTATIIPDNATDKTITWTSSNSSIASVSDGTVTALSKGTAIITATINNGKSAVCQVVVNEKEVEPPIEESKPMYYGYIPYDSSIEPATWKSEGFNLITEEWILDGVTNGNITKVDAGVMGKTSFGVVPKRSLLLIAVPSDSGLVATMDDGDGAKVKFDSTTPNSNGENTVTIDGIAYDLYGQYAPIDYPAESKFFYID